MRIFLKYSAGLIGLYLVVAYAAGSGTVITNASKGAGNLVKTFQARD